MVSRAPFLEKKLLHKIIYKGVSSQAGDSSIPSATATGSELCSFPWNKILIQSNLQGGTTFSHHFSNSRSLLGPIVGGSVAVFALLLLFTFLLLKHRASQRAIRLRAEIDPTPTGLNLDTREGLGRHVSVSVDGSRSEIPRLTGALMFRTRRAWHPHDLSFSLVFPSPIIPPANGSLKRARTNYTAHSPIHDERIYLASELEYTSSPISQVGGHFQSNSSHDLIASGATTEEMTHTSTYIPDRSPIETRFQTDLTNTTDSDYASNSAPPAYDSLPTPVSPVNSSHPKPWILHSGG